MLFTSPIYAENTNLSELLIFLDEDKTNENEYMPWYTCGHFARDVSRNSGELNIGSAILGNNSVFRGHNNHIINYVYIDDELLFIESQTDELYYATMSNYRYVRLYPDGIRVPSDWEDDLEHDIDLWYYEAGNFSQ